MKAPLILIKYTRYEYWPWLLFYIPVLPYWLLLAAKNRSLSYFTAANPGIELGGFYGESKSDILGLIDSQYLPGTIEVDRISMDEILKIMKEKAIKFPVIAKPDIGERGNGVVKLHNLSELVKYNIQCKSKYIIQEFIEFEYEFGVLYSRLPNSDKGQVTSVTLKEFLSVTGDGHSTIKELMQKSTRARFQISRIESLIGHEINTILPKNEKRIIEHIGNHCRGTRFIDNNYLINDKLHQVFDRISKPIDGFYYGRFDLKVKSVSDLYMGTNIKIMELNGASSEPGHIYDSSHTLFKAYKDLMKHWSRLSDVSMQNVKRGHKPVPFSVIVKTYLKFIVFKNA